MKTLAMAGAVVATLLPALALARGADAYRDAPPDERVRLVSAYEEAFAATKADLEAARAAVRRLRTPAERKAAAERLKILTARAKAIETNDPPYFPPMEDREFETGRIGTLDGGPDGRSWLEVVSVADGAGGKVTVCRVTGRPVAGGAVPASERRGLPFALVGVDAAATKAGERFPVEGPFRVEGEETHRTDFGATTTVFVLRKLDPKDPFGKSAAE